MLCDGGGYVYRVHLLQFSPLTVPPPTQDKVLALVSVTYHVWIISNKFTDFVANIETL